MNYYFDDVYIKKDYVVLKKDETECWAAYESVASTAQDYVEIVRVSVDDMNEIQKCSFDQYMIYNVMLHDPKGLIEIVGNEESVYIVYQVTHIYDANTDTFYHSTPTVIGAKSYYEDAPDDDWNFKCVVYVDQHEKLAVAPDMKSANAKYYDVDEDNVNDRSTCAVDFNFDVFICENVREDDGNIYFNDRKYESRCCNGTQYRFLALDGIENVIAGYRMSIRTISDNIYEGDGEFCSGTGHMDDVDFMP